MKFFNFKRIISHRFTFMLVPHGPGRPRQIPIPLPLIVLALLTWSGITLWGSYLSARHVDYWRAQLSNQILQLKVSYLLAQLDKSRAFMDEVKEVDLELRRLLNYSSDVAEVDKANSQKQQGAGGPNLTDQVEVARLLQASSADISWERLTERVSLMRDEAKDRVASFEKIKGWIETQRRLHRATPQGWPSPGHLSSHFGLRQSPFTGDEEYHSGVDISGPSGTPIRATADGVVQIASWNSGYGNLVVLRHEFGYATRYAHNSRLLVKPGDRVQRGKTIALMGQTGKASGPHCHYEVWKNDQRRNPYAFLRDMVHKSMILTRLFKSDDQKATGF